MANRPGYFADWYSKNKVALSRRRKLRYHTDEEYRSNVLSASRDYRKALRGERSDVLPSSGFYEPLVMEGKGREKIVGFTIGALAAYVGRGIQTVNAWQKRGVLPQTPHRDSHGRRRYTIEQMEVVRRILGPERKSYRLNGAGEEIRKAWDAGGFTPKASEGMPIRQLPRSRRPRKFRMRGGTVLSLFTIGGLGLYAGRSIQTLIMWERRGMLPETPYRDSTGRRYYTLEMMESVYKAIDGRERIFPIDPSVHNSIRSEWDGFNVPHKVVPLSAKKKAKKGKANG